MPRNDLNAEVNKQIGIVQRLITRLTSRLWKKCDIGTLHVGTKVKVFNAVVTSTLLYASGIWT